MKMLIAGAVLVSAIAAGIIYTGLYDVAASAPHNGATEWLLSAMMRASVERQARGIEIPNLDDEDLKLAGINDFNVMCAGCHGAPGRKPEAIGQGLNPAPPDLAESAARLSPAELFWVTKHGVRMTGMPAWGTTHGDESLWPVVAFLNELPGLDAAAYAAMLNRAKGRGRHASAEPAPAATGDDTAGDETSTLAGQPHDHGNHAH